VTRSPTRQLVVCLTLALPFLSACGSAFESCRSDRIEVALPATVDRDGRTQSVLLSGAVSPGNLSSGEEFENVRAVLTGDPAGRTGGVIWTVPAFETNPGWVAVALRAPLAPGDVLPVSTTVDGAGWGTFDLPQGTDVVVSLRAGSYVAVTASGTVRVLAVAPLRLRLDLTGRDAAGDPVRVRGDALFAFVSEPSPCT